MTPAMQHYSVVVAGSELRGIKPVGMMAWGGVYEKAPESWMARCETAANISRLESGL